MTPEPIRREERERWSRIVADRQGTGLIHEHVGRLLAALDAGEALAQAAQLAARTRKLEPLLAALAGWRAVVKA